jgi:hypothetical protein
MTESVSFAFGRNERVQPKGTGAGAAGKVIGLHVNRGGVRQYYVQHVKPDGELMLQFWDEDELEAASAAGPSATVDEKRAPAIAEIAHAALGAVINHPNTVAEVGKAVDAALGKGTAAGNIKEAVTAALSAVGKMATTDPQVKQAAGNAATAQAAKTSP